MADKTTLLKLIGDELIRLGMRTVPEYAPTVLEQKTPKELEAMLQRLASETAIDYSDPLMHIRLALEKQGLRTDSFLLRVWLLASGYQRWEELELQGMRSLYRDLASSRVENHERSLAAIAGAVLQLGGDALDSKTSGELRAIVAKANAHVRSTVAANC